LEDVEYMQAYVENVNDARNQFRDALMKFSFVQTVFESFGNFVLVKFVNADVKERLFQLLAENQIFTRNLTHHTELNSCLRITTGTLEQMNRVISVIEKFEA
jgi:histidinol-phosphate aminotransferase